MVTASVICVRQPEPAEMEAFVRAVVEVAAADDDAGLTYTYVASAVPAEAAGVLVIRWDPGIGADEVDIVVTQMLLAWAAENFRFVKDIDVEAESSGDGGAAVRKPRRPGPDGPLGGSAFADH